MALPPCAMVDRPSKLHKHFQFWRYQSCARAGRYKNMGALCPPHSLSYFNFMNRRGENHLHVGQ